MSGLSLQEIYAPKGICFGCGCGNGDGLGVKSFVKGERVVSEWMPKPHHEAFPGVINGGIIGSIMDCHCNWTAAYHMMQSQGLDSTPCTVTAEYTIKLKRPTPSGILLSLDAKLSKIDKNKAWVEADLIADGKVCAVCTGLFVAVGEDHPAYHRW